VRGRPTGTGPAHRRFVVRRLGAVGVLVAVLGLAYLLWFTSVFGVRSVTVTGLDGLGEDEVRTAAAIDDGTPMVRLDTDEVASRVAALSRVAAVDVARSWPNTVEVAVTERVPVAVVAAADGAHLVDETGLDFAVVPTPPTGLPELRVHRVDPADAETGSAMAVLATLPEQLRTQVTVLRANSPSDIELTLADGRTVEWGGAADAARKAAVIIALLTRPGTTYDVSTPDFPTVS